MISFHHHWSCTTQSLILVAKLLCSTTLNKTDRNGMMPPKKRRFVGIIVVTCVPALFHGRKKQSINEQIFGLILVVWYL